MLTVLLILVIGLTPSLFSAWVIRRADARLHERLDSVIGLAAIRSVSTTALSSSHNYIEGTGYIIGDLTCKSNARSRYIRCAVNPLGPCEGCFFYEPHEIKDA